MDPWFLFFQIDKGQLSTWGLLWSQHNGHRIVLPKLFNLADLYWFHGKTIFLLVSIYLVQLLHCGLLIYFVRRFGAFKGAVFRSAAGLILFCLFSPAKREVFIFGWEISYVLPVFFSTLAILALAISSREQPKNAYSRWIFIAWGAATGASFSLLSGFLVWPMLVLEAILFRLPRRVAMNTALISAVAIVLNFIGFHTEAHIGLLDAGQHSRQIFEFFDLLMAESWPPISFYLGVIVAWVGVLICLEVAFWRTKQQEGTPQFEVALALVSLIAIAAVAMTTMGRWNVGFTNRYEEPVFLFWTGFGLLLFTFVRRPSRQKLLASLQLVVIFIAGAGLTRIKPLIAEANLHRQALNVAGAALASRVMDPSAVQFLAMPAIWTFGELDFLQSLKAAIYADKPESAIGKKLSDVYRISENACSGELKATNFIGDPNWPGGSIRGSAWNIRMNKPVEKLIITDNNGKIVGLGANDSFLPNHSDERRANWNAFVPAAAEGKRFGIYGVVSDDEVCRLSGLASINQVNELAQFNESASKMVPLWTPSRGIPQIVGGTGSIHDGVLAIQSDGPDTQAYFEIGTDLSQFSTIAIKAKFARVDTVELFFGRLIEGRGIEGFASVPNRWVMLRANVGLNPYWKKEAGSTIRFDPTGALGRGATTEIAEIWGDRSGITSGGNLFESQLVTALR